MAAATATAALAFLPSCQTLNRACQHSSHVAQLRLFRVKLPFKAADQLVLVLVRHRCCQCKMAHENFPNWSRGEKERAGGEARSVEQPGDLTPCRSDGGQLATTIQPCSSLNGTLLYIVPSTSPHEAAEARNRVTRRSSRIPIAAKHIWHAPAPCRGAQARPHFGAQRRAARRASAVPQQQHPWRLLLGRRAPGWRACWRGRRARLLAWGSRRAALRQVRPVRYMADIRRPAGGGAGA